MAKRKTIEFDRLRKELRRCNVSEYEEILREVSKAHEERIERISSAIHGSSGNSGNNMTQNSTGNILDSPMPSHSGATRTKSLRR